MRRRARAWRGGVKPRPGAPPPHPPPAPPPPGPAPRAAPPRHPPPSLHFDEPSPAFDLDALRLRVVEELEPWPAHGAVARTAVNSFGFGGSNANAVLEQAPDAEAAETPHADGPQL